MKLNKYVRRIACCLTVVALLGSAAHAQMVERLCRTDYEIDPERQGELLVELDNISFFKDNEFAGSVINGYSLPGLWLQPKGVFYPLQNIKLELGVHALIYSGAYKFPNYAYHDIAIWKGNQYQRGTHILPYFRAQLALSRVNLVLGNLYGGENHRMIEPLYTPELNLTAAPETGFQVLCDLKRWHFDAWINWQSFIFEADTHQEAFTVGLSSLVKFNRPESRFHYYLPVQMTIQHRGGEQIVDNDRPVQTLANGSVGAGIVWNVNRKVLKRINVEADMLGYYQESGKLWPFDKGVGLYTKASFDLGNNIRVKGGYFVCKDFISLFGIPYFGAVSMKTEGAVYDDPQTCFLSVEYSRTFGKHYAFGAKGDLYYSMPGTMKLASGELVPEGSMTNFSFGVYLRVNPAFLIKKFK